jgi:NAD(P)-dependent dehydrogenase (short-subunit alcohol dehydrogenase family)
MHFARRRSPRAARPSALEAFNQQAQRFALRRGGQPDEIVGAARYFATEASSYATGAVLESMAVLA